MPTTPFSGRTRRSTCGEATRRASTTSRSSASGRSRTSGMQKIPPHHDPTCWGCGDKPAGLGLPRPGAEGLTDSEAYFSFDERHQGGPGLAHGGLVSAALDEACGLLATWDAFPTVTARMFVRLRRA